MSIYPVYNHWLGSIRMWCTPNLGPAQCRGSQSTQVHLNVVEMGELQDVGTYARPREACKAIVGKSTSGIQGRREVEASGTESSKIPIRCRQKGYVCRYCLSINNGREVS